MNGPSRCIPTTQEATLGSDSQAGGGGKEKIRIGLAVFNLIARNYWNSVEIDIQLFKDRPRGLHPSACRNRPGDIGLRQKGKKFAGAR